jgi:hypothetical protein
VTVAYAMSDMGPSTDGRIDAGTVSLPADRGGCGEQHKVFLNEDNRPAVECTECAPVLVATHPAFAGTPNGVALTCDELADRELAERDGVAMQRVMMARVTDHFVKELTGKVVEPETPKLNASTLAAQLAAMTPAERAEIAKLLGGPAPAPAVQAAPVPAAPAAHAEPAAKKPVGRPRKLAG